MVAQDPKGMNSYPSPVVRFGSIACPSSLPFRRW